MTLFIAFLVLHMNEASWWLYLVAVSVWVCSKIVNSGSRAHSTVLAKVLECKIDQLRDDILNSRTETKDAGFVRRKADFTYTTLDG